MLPSAVANTKYFSPSKLFSGKTNMLDNDSSFFKFKRLTIAFPLAVGEDSGIFQVFNLYAIPPDEKNNILSCVLAVKTCVTKSSALVFIPERPLPPLL